MAWNLRHLHCLSDNHCLTSWNPWRRCNLSLRTSSPCPSSQSHPTCSWVPRPKGQGLQGGAKSILGINKDKKTWRTTLSMVSSGGSQLGGAWKYFFYVEVKWFTFIKLFCWPCFGCMSKDVQATLSTIILGPCQRLGTIMLVKFGMFQNQLFCRRPP